MPLCDEEKKIFDSYERRANSRDITLRVDGDVVHHFSNGKQLFTRKLQDILRDTPGRSD